MLKCFKHSSIQIDYCLYWSHVELMAVCLPMCHRHARSCVVPSHLYIVFVWWLAWEFLGFAYKIYVDITICVCVSLVVLFRVWKLIFSLVCFFEERFLLKFHCFCSVLKSMFSEKKKKQCRNVRVWHYDHCALLGVFFCPLLYMKKSTCTYKISTFQQVG